MPKHPWTKKTLVAAMALSTLMAGCGTPANQAQNANNATTGNTTGTTGAGGGGFKVGLVTDSGGLNDHGFNYLANQGMQKAVSALGITGQVVQSNSPSDYVPNLTRFAQQGFNLVIAVGFLMHDAVESVSQKFPNTKFLIIDDVITNRKNVTCENFQTEQCGYLVGALAGLMEKQKNISGLNAQNVVGVVGGMDIPPVDSYIAGFQQGVKRTNPGATVLVRFAGTFSDQALGSQVAQNEISGGADILFPVAGSTGVGVIHAAQSAGVYAIGVDADQNYLAKQTVLTSALKGVDTATYDVIQQTKNNQFKAGIQNFGLRDGGVGIAKPIATVPASVVSQVNDLAKQISSGTIKVSPTMQK